MAVGSSPSVVTDFSTSQVTVVVAKTVVTWSTEPVAARSVEVLVADGSVAVLDDWQ